MARLCVVSFKECWRASNGTWYSSGGFPMQVAAIASLFDEVTLVVVEVEPRSGGVALPPHAKVVGLASPVGVDFRRKLSVGARLPYYLKRIAREVRSADVVHTPLPGDLAFLGFLTALALRKPLLARYGGSWSDTGETTLMNRVTRQCMRLAAGGRNVMLATGAGDHPPAPGISWLFASAVSQAEIAALQPDPERAANVPLRLIYAGRLSSEKGVEDLIAAMALLRTEHRVSAQELRLVLAGDGPLRERLMQQIRERGCGDMVELVGQLARPALLETLASGDVCVLPSRSEAFCKARLDAMLCGVPVITTEVGFGRHIVGTDGLRGWLVSPRDPAGLASAIARVLHHPPHWAALRRRCRTFAEGLTIEAWTTAIAQRCARQWNVALVEGKLRW